MCIRDSCYAFLIDVVEHIHISVNDVVDVEEISLEYAVCRVSYQRRFAVFQLLDSAGDKAVEVVVAGAVDVAESADYYRETVAVVEASCQHILTNLGNVVRIASLESCALCVGEYICLLYTSDAADDLLCVVLGG